MKGVILAGGTGSRLYPSTKVTNKHLLNVWDRPMIYFPLETLISAGINDIMIITGTEHAGSFIELLGSGYEWNVEFTYKVQDKAGGIAQALGLCKKFIGKDRFAVILGDNVYEQNISTYVNEFEKSEHENFIFLKEVDHPSRFGVVELDGNKNVISIEEKPESPKSKFAVTGLYMYSSNVFEFIKEMKPSRRGELEITDVNNWYLKNNKSKAFVLDGFWSDAGTKESLNHASEYAKNKYS